MTRKDCLDAYQDYSRQASENARRLSFAAIAIIWVFKTEVGDGPVAVPAILLWSGLAVVLSLTFDLLQYIYGTAAWGIFHRRKELSNVPPGEQFKAPAWINRPTGIFFALKVVMVGLAYVFLLLFLMQLLLSG